MNLLVHVLLFLVVSVAIVTLGAFYSEREDTAALRSLPKRFAVFLLGCTVLAIAMLALEAVFVS